MRRASRRTPRHRRPACRGPRPPACRPIAHSQRSRRAPRAVLHSPVAAIPTATSTPIPTRHPPPRAPVAGDGGRRPAVAARGGPATASSSGGRAPNDARCAAGRTSPSEEVSMSRLRRRTTPPAGRPARPHALHHRTGASAWIAVARSSPQTETRWPGQPARRGGRGRRTRRERRPASARSRTSPTLLSRDVDPQPSGPHRRTSRGQRRPPTRRDESARQDMNALTTSARRRGR